MITEEKWQNMYIKCDVGLFGSWNTLNLVIDIILKYNIGT